MIQKQIFYIFIIMVLVPSAMAAGDFNTPIPTPIQLTIPTYDGSGQTVHPDVVYFPNSWNGYKYWMAITPYPNGNGAYENPSILISNDGKSWSVPNGLTNPVVQKPSEIAENEDPELVFNKALNRLELYYGEGGAGTSYLKRKTSMDGVTWSPAQTSISLPDWYIMSPSIVKNDNSYNLWYTGGATCSADITVKYTNSADGIGFSSPQSVNFNQNVNVWHINVEYIPTRNEYWMVYAAYPKGSTCGNTDLYFAKSTDKINWISSGDKILPRDSFFTSEVYRSAFLFDETTNIMKLWISGRNGNVWRTGYSEVPIITDPITPTPTPTPTQESQISDSVGATRTFSITANKTVNVTWYINGTEVKSSEKGVTNAIYTNTSAAQGTWIVKATATNTNGSVSKEWIWIVNTLSPAPSRSAPSITGLPQESQISDNVGVTRTFNITANQTVNVTWYINGTEVKSSEKGVTSAIYTNISAAQGTWIVNATATNANGTVSKEWKWIVTSPLIITITSPANNSENRTGDVRVTVNLSRDGTALLNWSGVNESMDGAGTSFSMNKTGLLSGTHKFRIFANDSAGISNVSEIWTITVKRSISKQLDINASTFILNDTIIITSPGGNVTVTVPNGTNASVNGSYLPSISIDSLAEMNSTFMAKLGSSDKLIGENLSLGPAGAIFRPDIQIRFNYTDPQLTAAGISESDLSVKYYNTTKNNWEALPIYERNSIGNYIIVNASHFSIFTLVGTTTIVTSTPLPNTTVTSTPPPNSGGGGSSGGGGGGDGSSGENYNNIEVIEKYDLQISKDALTSYRFTHLKNPIMYVNITGNTSLALITASMEVLKNISTLVKVLPDGLVYKNVNIWIGTSGFATPKNIKEALIKFKIDNVWLSANDVLSSDIVLRKWDGTSWIKLETKVLSKDDTNTYFEGKTNAFSPFAITQFKESVPPAMPPQATVQSGIPATVTNATPGKATSEGAPPINFGIIIAMFVIIGIVTAVYIKRR